MSLESKNEKHLILFLFSCGVLIAGLRRCADLNIWIYRDVIMCFLFLFLLVYFL